MSKETSRPTFIEPAITTADGARLEKFYTDGLGYSLAELLELPVGKTRRMKRDNAVLKIFEPLDDPKPRDRGMSRVGWAFATLHVDDVEADVARVVSSGGKVLQGAVEYAPGNWFALIEDPDGNPWELLKGANPL